MTHYMSKLLDRMNEPCDCVVCGESFPFCTMTTTESGHEVCEGCLHDHTQAIDTLIETFYYLSEEY
jgi:hypothetical protein